MTKKARRPTPDLSRTIDYSQRLLDPTGWIRCADSLLAAARLLESEISHQWAGVVVEEGRVVQTSGRQDVHGPYFLLVAFALENLFKAAWVSVEGPRLRSRLIPSLPPFLNGHDLLKLASKAAFSVSMAEEDLLRRLSRNSVWAGRYPVPAGPTAARAVEQYSDGGVRLTAYFAPDDIEHLGLLVARIRAFAVGRGKSLASRPSSASTQEAPKAY